MGNRQQTFDKCQQINTKAQHKDYIDSITTKLLNYYSDPEKKNRKNNKHLCRYCFYVDTSRIGGCAMTTINCACCGREMLFANTCTDVFCDECAAELNYCKHCGVKID